MGGLQNWSGQFGEDKISSLNGNEHKSSVVHQHFQAKIRSTYCNTAKERTFKIEKLLHISQLTEEHVPLHNGKCFTEHSWITLDTLQDKHENFNKIKVIIVLI